MQAIRQYISKPFEQASKTGRRSLARTSSQKTAIARSTDTVSPSFRSFFARYPDSWVSIRSLLDKREVRSMQSRAECSECMAERPGHTHVACGSSDVRCSTSISHTRSPTATRSPSAISHLEMTPFSMDGTSRGIGISTCSGGADRKRRPAGMSHLHLARRAPLWGSCSFVCRRKTAGLKAAVSRTTGLNRLPKRQTHMSVLLAYALFTWTEAKHPSKNQSYANNSRQKPARPEQSSDSETTPNCKIECQS